MWRGAAGCWVGLGVAAVSALAQEIELPRPGTITLAEMTGRVTFISDGERKPLKVEDRVAIGATLATERRSMATLHFSNGAAVQLGPEAEFEIEEFGQAPATSASKFAELKAEPTVSRVRLRLGRGDVSLDVKPLKVARGSSFTIALPAGTLRIREGALRAAVTISEFGLGVCTLELLRGAAEFELPGAVYSPVPIGRKLAFAIERDRATGAISVSEMPKEKPAAAK
jgi:hypothetical protein